MGDLAWWKGSMVMIVVIITALIAALFSRDATASRDTTDAAARLVEGTDHSSQSASPVNQRGADVDRSVTEADRRLLDTEERAADRVWRALRASGATTSSVATQLLSQGGDRVARTIAIELDVLRDLEALGLFLAAWGSLPDEDRLRALLDLYSQLGEEAQELLILALAQHRGSEPLDPERQRSHTQWSELAPIREPFIRDWLNELVERQVRQRDRVESRVALVLAMSAHLDQRFDSWLSTRSRGESVDQPGVATVYLCYGRTDAARGLALELLRDEHAPHRLRGGALATLKRRALDADVEAAIVAAMERGPVEGRVTVIRGLTHLFVSRNVDRAVWQRLTDRVVKMLHTVEEPAEVRGAATFVVANAANRLGGWDRLHLDPVALVVDASIPLKSRIGVIRIWARQYWTVRSDALFEKVLDPAIAPVEIREAAWRALRSTADTEDRMDRLQGVALRFTPTEKDADILKIMTRLKTTTRVDE